ncbi:unnamed protein product [Arctia plantaginis]|uniref:Uncharacterized protein n=1 Tax=Arctia plantaginis TaxID=874455 RepID=A0A8S1AAW6_ARCPL|nr:unnamed protein product [Arctia plantaginis]
MERRFRSASRTLEASHFQTVMQARSEHKCWDPKDGELCLVRSKSGETWMEDRSDSDVQIDRRNWPRERAWKNQRGKKTLLSLTLVWYCEET